MGTQPLSDTLNNLISRLGLLGRIHEEMFILLWPGVVGREISRNTRPLKVKDGVMTVRVRNSVWAAQLSFLKDDIIGKLAEKTGKSSLRDIRFIVGDILNDENDEVPGGLRFERLQTRPANHTKVNPALIDVISESVGDPSVRSVFLRAVSSHARLKEARLCRGWKPCAACGAIHPRGPYLCTPCRTTLRRKGPIADVGRSSS